MPTFHEFYDTYLNIPKMIKEKRKYKAQQLRVEALPEDYRFVYKKIQSHMWMFAAGSGYDMIDIHSDLLELFEAGAANGKSVLEITGNDVAGFCDDLLKNAQTYTENWREKLNRSIQRHFDLPQGSNQ
jgi:DNA-binding ferritin-like protein (Dps family)